MVDGKLVVRCKTKNNEYILVNEDGEIIESRLVHYSDDNINTFKIDNGYLTPKMSIRRHLIVQDFAGDIEGLYA